MSSLIYVGIKGSVIALDQRTGCRVWETQLRSGDFVNLLVEGDRVFATTRGEIFCLDAANGKVAWHDPLKGFGWGLASLATVERHAPVGLAAAEEQRRRQAAAASAAAAS